MSNYTLKAGSVADTHAVAGLVAKYLRGGSFIGLSGPLGAGKTEFVRGLARGLGVPDGISSPTFVLESVYPVSSASASRGKVTTLHHWDLYRLGSEYSESELHDYPGDETKVVVIEWPERVGWVEDLLSLRIRIDFMDSWTAARASDRTGEPAADANERVITFVDLTDSTLIKALTSFVAERAGR